MIDKPSPQEVQAERDQAMQEYHAELDAVKARTAKLRAERLAREAAGIALPVKAPAPRPAALTAKAPAKTKTTKPRLTKAKAKPAVQ